MTYPENGASSEITIRSAAPDSFVTLRTDRNGTDNEPGKVNAMLEKLANKLIYKGYTAGERNLDGEVEIAEGLTAASEIWKKASSFLIIRDGGIC